MAYSKLCFDKLSTRFVNAQRGAASLLQTAREHPRSEKIEAGHRFRNAAWLVAWDEARAAHVYRHHIDIAIRGNGIVFLGTSMMPMQLIAARGVHLAYGYLFIIAFSPHNLEAAQPGINCPWPAGICAT